METNRSYEYSNIAQAQTFTFFHPILKVYLVHSWFLFHKYTPGENSISTYERTKKKKKIQLPCAFYQARACTSVWTHDKKSVPAIYWSFTLFSTPFVFVLNPAICRYRDLCNFLIGIPCNWLLSFFILLMGISAYLSHYLFQLKGYKTFNNIQKKKKLLSNTDTTWHQEWKTKTKIIKWLNKNRKSIFIQHIKLNISSYNPRYCCT